MYPGFTVYTSHVNTQTSSMMGALYYLSLLTTTASTLQPAMVSAFKSFTTGTTLSQSWCWRKKQIC